MHPVAYYTIIKLAPFNFSVFCPQGGAMLLHETIFQFPNNQSIPLVSTCPNQNMPDLMKRQGRGGRMASVTPPSQPRRVCVRACVRALACLSDLFPGTRRQGALRCKSAHEVLVPEHECRPMFSPTLPGTLNDFFFFLFPLSGRSWEERSSLSHKNLKAKTRQDVTSS